jgi:hypothetical protein
MSHVAGHPDPLPPPVIIIGFKLWIGPPVQPVGLAVWQLQAAADEVATSRVAEELAADCSGAGGCGCMSARGRGAGWLVTRLRVVSLLPAPCKPLAGLLGGTFPRGPQDPSIDMDPGKSPVFSTQDFARAALSGAWGRNGTWRINLHELAAEVNGR